MLIERRVLAARQRRGRGQVQIVEVTGLVLTRRTAGRRRRRRRRWRWRRWRRWRRWWRWRWWRRRRRRRRRRRAACGGRGRDPCRARSVSGIVVRGDADPIRRLARERPDRVRRFSRPSRGPTGDVDVVARDLDVVARTPPRHGHARRRRRHDPEAPGRRRSPVVGGGSEVLGRRWVAEVGSAGYADGAGYRADEQRRNCDTEPTAAARLRILQTMRDVRRRHGGSPRVAGSPVVVMGNLSRPDPVMTFCAIPIRPRSAFCSEGRSCHLREVLGVSEDVLRLKGGTVTDRADGCRECVTGLPVPPRNVATIGLARPR